MLYTSDRIFKIWSYSVSHSILLLRSTNDEEDEGKAMKEGFNIDIEFTGVGYLDIPVMLKGISVNKIEEYKKFDKYSARLGYKIFEIKSDRDYFIIASSCVVGKNNWINEDRLINPYLHYDEVLATS